MQFKRQKHENFRKNIFGMELVLCMTPIFRPVSHFLFADGREHLCLMDTFIFYLYLLTVNLIIRPWLFGEVADCSIEADDCQTSFFIVATRLYRLLSNYLIFRAMEIVE